MNESRLGKQLALIPLNLISTESPSCGWAAIACSLKASSALGVHALVFYQINFSLCLQDVLCRDASRNRVYTHKMTPWVISPNRRILKARHGGFVHLRKRSVSIYYYKQTPADCNYYFLFLLLWQSGTLQRETVCGPKSLQAKHKTRDSR